MVVNGPPLADAPMRALVFALEFRGSGRAVPGKEGAREARTTAPVDRLVAFAGADWLRPHVAAEPAVLEARVQRSPDGTFVEEGTITYGTAGMITFETVGRGWVEPGPESTATVGTVMWRVVDGKGAFAGATGLITSNFTVSGAGDVVDNHMVRMFVRP